MPLEIVVEAIVIEFGPLVPVGPVGPVGPATAEAVQVRAPRRLRSHPGRCRGALRLAEGDPPVAQPLHGQRASHPRGEGARPRKVAMFCG